MARLFEVFTFFDWREFWTKNKFGLVGGQLDLGVTREFLRES